MNHRLPILVSLFFILAVSVPLSLFAQTTWNPFITVYDQDSMKIGVSFSYPGYSCNMDSSHNAYRFIVMGKLPAVRETMNVSFDYEDCNGQTQTLSVPIDLPGLSRPNLIERSYYRYRGGEAFNIRTHTGLTPISGARPPREDNRTDSPTDRRNRIGNRNIPAPVSTLPVQPPKNSVLLSVASGLDMLMCPLLATTTHYDNYGTTYNAINPIGTGPGGAVSFLPLVMRRWDMGIYMDGGIGWGVYGGDDGSAYQISTSYRYARGAFGLHLAGGGERVKLLGKYYHSFQMHDYYSTESYEHSLLKSVSASSYFQRQVFAGGLRTLSLYNNGERRKMALDVMLTIARDLDDHNFVNNWQYGFSLALWAPGLVRCNLDFSFENIRETDIYHNHVTKTRTMMQLSIFYDLRIIK